ncbi:MAG TPA: hypothetical protein VGN20_29055 [Mucilaginibacter sp.]|jgi:ketosteroid isomerase-like protein
MKKSKTAWTILCLTFFFICNNCSAQTNKDPELTAVRKVIERNNVRYFDLFSNKDESIVNLYTEDACLLVPNTPAICGGGALAKDFKDTYASGKIKGVKFVTLNVYGDGKAYVTEEGTWQVFDPEGRVLDDGKYLKLWKKTKEGWKIFRDLFNSDHSGK